MNQITDSFESGCGSVISIPKSGCMALIYGLVKASHENRRHGRSQASFWLRAELAEMQRQLTAAVAAKKAPNNYSTSSSSATVAATICVIAEST
ncbi:unnamed protein product [Lasius platythorax]|uniref:Uncharacterized protein n=1 Tax=Lasius platythorax TaxID=488582 RepID=A0AAV2MZ68_9HYME